MDGVGWEAGGKNGGIVVDFCLKKSMGFILCHFYYFISVFII